MCAYTIKCNFFQVKNGVAPMLEVRGRMAEGREKINIDSFN